MYQAKRTWKPVTQGTLYEMYLEVCEEARRLGFLTEDNPPLFIDSSYVALGKCHWQIRNGQTYTAVTLSKHVVDNPYIREVIIHEIGHVVSKISDHHNWRWNYRANKIGEKWGIKTSTYETNESLLASIRSGRPQSTYKYAIYCPKCSAEWKYKTFCQAVKRPERYVCTKCREKLKFKEL